MEIPSTELQDYTGDEDGVRRTSTVAFLVGVLYSDLVCSPV